MSLPAYTMGQVNLLDWSPVLQAQQNALGRAMQQRKMDQETMLQNERLGMDRERLGMDQQRFQDDRDRRNELGRILDPSNPNFRDVPPQLVELSRATRDPSPIVQHYVNSQKGTDDIKEFEYARRQGFQGQFSDWMAIKRKGAEEEYNKNLVYGTDERGNIVPMQAGTKGNLVASKLPPGVALQRDPIKFDAGDRYILLDPTTRQPIGAIPKNIAGVEEQKVLGEDAGKVKVAAPKMIAAQEALERDHRIMRDEIDKTREIAARSPVATGVPALLLSRVPGTTGYQVARLLDTIKARAGFDVLGNMRASSPTGGALGAITERELAFLQSVQGSLEQVQSQEDLDRVLARLAEYTESANDTRRRALEYDLKRAGVSPDLLNRQQMLSPFARTAQDTTKMPEGGPREFVGMQVDSRPGIPVAPQQAAPPAQPQVPLPKERRAYPQPPAPAVEELMRSPSPQMKAFFDEEFGPGSADAVLKGRR